MPDNGEGLGFSLGLILLGAVLVFRKVYSTMLILKRMYNVLQCLWQV